MNIRIPPYTKKSHTGAAVDNQQDYLPQVTHPSDPVDLVAVDAYKRTGSIHVEDKPVSQENIPKNPLVQRWIFSTDCVGHPLNKDYLRYSIDKKNWTTAIVYAYSPMFEIGVGNEYHYHNLGEYLHRDHISCQITVMAIFPSLFVKERENINTLSYLQFVF